MLALQDSPGHYVPWMGGKVTKLSTGEEITLSPNAEGAWSQAELADVNLFPVIPFTLPAGKIPSGGPTYTRSGGLVNETYNVVDYVPNPEQVRRKGFSDDPLVQGLLNNMDTMDNAAIDQWFANNVTTLAQARNVLAALTKAVVLLARRVVP